MSETRLLANCHYCCTAFPSDGMKEITNQSQQMDRRAPDQTSSDKSSLVLLVVAAAALILFTFYRHRLTANALSRIITVERLVEAGTMVQNDTRFRRFSIDSVMVGNKRYSSKPPNYTFLLAGESLIIRKVTGFDFYAHRRFYVWVLVFLNQVIPYLVLLYLALKLISRLTSDTETRNFFFLAMTLGSLPYGYAVTLNNHVPAAVAVFVAFYLVYVIRTGEAEKWYHYFSAGFLVGLAATFELVGIVLVFVFLVLLFMHDKKKATFAILGAVLPFIPTFATFYCITGSLKPFYLQKHLYHYAGSPWLNLKGMDALDEPKWLYLLNVTIGHHGLFVLTPLFLLSFTAVIRIIRNRTCALRTEFIALTIGIIAMMVLVIFTTKNYGGVCIGMRWFIIFMPLLMLLTFSQVKNLGGSLRKALYYVLLLLSSVSVLEALRICCFVNGMWHRLLGGPPGNT